MTQPTVRQHELALAPAVTSPLAPEVEDALIALLAQLIQGVYPRLAAETSDEQDQRVEHLARQAFVYIRQSTLDQVQHHLESQRRQYRLAERARQLGWAEAVVIDEDLGQSGSGVHRPGFEPLLGQRCAMATSARCSASRLRAWRAMDATGTRCSSFVVS